MILFLKCTHPPPLPRLSTSNNETETKGKSSNSVAFARRHHTRLFHAVEELLTSSGPLLDPSLVFRPPEKLRGLHDSDGGIHEVGEGFSQKIGPRAEIGVEYDDGFP